jgi:phosphatidylglycerophosphate synthase
VDDPTALSDRRPIAARDYALSQGVAAWLARRGVSANAISVAGMLAGIAAGAAFALTSFPDWRLLGFLAAALLIQLRLAANMLDGMVAVRTGTSSPVGALYNEIPDRVSDAATCIGAGYAAGAAPELGYLAACVALLVAYVRAQGRASGAPQEFCGPLAKQQRMALLTVAAVASALLPEAWLPALEGPPGFGLMALALAVIVVGGLLTACRRLLRIARHLREVRP